MKIADRLRRFEGYEGREEKEGIHLDKNENSFGLPKDLKDEIFEELKETPLNRYPPIDPVVLREKIAEYIGSSKENIVLGNGTDPLLPLIYQLFKSEQVVINPPTFAMYSFYAKREGLTVNRIPLDGDFEISCRGDLMKEPSIVCICSPNNPTGNVQPREKIIDVLETDNIVILDEAYAEFSDTSFLDLIEEYDNLIVLRTLSKAFALAGLRVGYAVGSPQIIDSLRSIRTPYSLSVLSIKIAIKALENKDTIQKSIDRIVDERERIINEFKNYAHPSDTNFILLDLDAYDYLKERDIYVRKMKGRLEGKIRVTVGKDHENDMLISALNDFIGETK